jgi:hypothetical protein
MGINAGPMLLAIENYRSQMIWRLTSRNPEIKAGLDGLLGVSLAHRVARSADRKGGDRKVKLSWQRQAGTVRHNVYASNGGENWSLLQADIRGTSWTGYEPASAPPYTYLVKAFR